MTYNGSTSYGQGHTDGDELLAVECTEQSTAAAAAAPRSGG